MEAQERKIKAKTAVVLLNWNGKGLLEKFLPSITKYTNSPDTAIVVADNGSSDDSVDFVRSGYPKVDIIELGENFGFAEGYNRALKQIQAEYFVLLNTDVEVSENWIEPLIENLDNNPDIAACQPKIMAYHHKDHFEYAGACGGYIDKYGYPFCRGRIMDFTEKDEGQYNEKIDVFWATGACLFIRSDIYFKAGALDADFFAHMEEIDLCWRINNMGHRINVVPESTVYHMGGATLSTLSPRKTYLNFRNNLLLLYKNTKPGKLFGLMLIRLILDGIAAIKFLLGGEFKYFKAVFNAHISFYKMKKDFKAKRKENVLKLFKKYDHSTVYNRMIIADYFIKGKRKYSELDF
jgi:GT2 family glycosyltransferase